MLLTAVQWVCQAGMLMASGYAWCSVMRVACGGRLMCGFPVIETGFASTAIEQQHVMPALLLL
jgi:hypothetical protein